MNTKVKSPEEAMAVFAGQLASLARSTGSTTFVALCYWCEEVWPICQGDDKDAVEEAAKLYLEMWPSKYDDKGNFVNGHGAEGYWVLEVPKLSNV